MFDHIVIAVDGSDEARRAARRGLGLAQSFDATVDVLSVVEQKALRIIKPLMREISCANGGGGPHGN